jgi:hypothetical protein
MAEGQYLEPQTATAPPYAVSIAEAVTMPLRELLDARRDQIKAVVERHHGVSVAVFGSVARGESWEFGRLPTLPCPWIDARERESNRHPRRVPRPPGAPDVISAFEPSSTT